MRRVYLLIGLLLAILARCGSSIAVEPVPFAPGKLDALLDHMEQELKTVKSLSVEFQQEKHLSLLSDVVESRGVCLFVAPNNVRFEVVEPFRSVLIAHGPAVAKYEWLSGTWQKVDIASPDTILMVTGQIASWLQGRFRDDKGIYDISAVAADHTTIILTPRPAGMRQHITSIELDLADDLSKVVVVTIREPGGDFTRVQFRNEQRNTALPPAVFETGGVAPTQLPPASPAATRPGA